MFYTHSSTTVAVVFVTAKVSTSFLFSNTNVIYPSIAFMAILGVFFLFFSLPFTIYNKSIFFIHVLDNVSTYVLLLGPSGALR